MYSISDWENGQPRSNSNQVCCIQCQYQWEIYESISVFPHRYIQVPGQIWIKKKTLKFQIASPTPSWPLKTGSIRKGFIQKMSLNCIFVLYFYLLYCMLFLLYIFDVIFTTNFLFYINMYHISFYIVYL